MRELPFDLRDCWRGLRRDRFYALTVVATLAVTLGASVAVFSIVNGVLLRPLAYPESEALVSIREVMPGEGQRYLSVAASPRHFDYWRDRVTALASIAAMDWRTQTLTGAGEAAQVVVLRASGTIFDVLRTPIARGRLLTRDDEREDQARVAVISDRLWRERLGSDAAVIGRRLTLGGIEHTIVGVLPQGYTLPRLQMLGEAGATTADAAAIVPFRVRMQSYSWKGQHNYSVVARLKPGVTIDGALAEMNVLQNAVAEFGRREGGGPYDLKALVLPLEQAIIGPVRRGLWLLLGAIGALLLIACANLANLTLTRTIGRIRDAAVRGALGASRARLIRAAVLDQLVLATLGGALGVVLAATALELFVTTAPVTLPRVQDVVIDGRVLAFGGVIALLAGLAVAILPAYRLGRGDLEHVLRSGGRGTDAGTQRARTGLLVAQVALSVMLLAVSGLFLSSLMRLMRVDAGFTAAGAVTVEIAPVGTTYPNDGARAALYDRVLERVRAIPEVTTASFTSALPLTGETWVDRVVRPERGLTTDQSPSANFRFVGPGYFAAIGMPILRGRTFDEHDRRNTTTPALVSSATALTLWPNEEAIGREFKRGDPVHRYQVVGIVPDGRVTALETTSPLMVYLPYWHNNEGKSVLVMRARGDTGALFTAVRAVIRDIDPEIAIARTAPLQQVVDGAVENRRYQASLFTTFGGAALLITIVGVYAATAYGVSRRRRELNVRVALGARASQVFSMMVRQNMVPVSVGLAAGMIGALILGGTVASLLYEVRPRDPIVLATVLGLVAAVGLMATITATLGSLEIDPAAALRDD